MSIHALQTDAKSRRSNGSKELAPISLRPKPPIGKDRGPSADLSLPRKRRAQPFDIKTERPPSVVEPESQRRRNERLMSSMVGHLKKAKTSLDEQQDIIKAQREVTQKKRREAEQQEQEWRAEEEHKKEQELHAALEKKKLQDMKSEAEDLGKLAEKLDNFADIKARFCRTAAEPFIFWMPKKETAATEKSKARTLKELEEERCKWRLALAEQKATLEVHSPPQ